MNRKWLIAVLTMAAIVASPPGRSQSRGDSTDATMITLGSATGPPGGKVTVSLALTAAPGVRVGQLETIVTFPTPQLLFAAAETGGLADGVDAQLRTETLASGGDGKSHVRLTLSTLTGRATRQPLPNGVLVYLTFEVATAIEPDIVIPVDATGAARTLDDPPGAVEPLTVKGTNVTVGDTPITSCFFYMH